MASARKPNASKAKISKQEPDLQKRKEAMEYRLRGYSYVAIGGKLGVSSKRAYELVAEGLTVARAEFTEKGVELMEFELNRIDRMITGLEDMIFPPDEVMCDLTDEVRNDKYKISLKAMEMADKLLERKAKLLGFYRQDDANKTKEPLPWVDND